MSLKVELAVEKTDLLFQEDTYFEVTITNLARQNVTTTDPRNALTLPALRVSERRGSWEETFRRPPDRVLNDPQVQLAPGQTLKGRYRLLQYVSFPKPGEYEIAAIWEWDGGRGREQSAPVQARIQVVTPRNPHTVSTTGGPASLYYSVWINAAGEHPTLCRSVLDASPDHPLVQNTQVLGRISGAAEPCLSVPAQGGFTRRQWVAWFEGDTLKIGETGPGDEPIETTDLALSSAPKMVVPPLNHMAVAQGLEGRFYLWQGNPEGSVSRFQEVRVDARGLAEPGMNAMLEGGRPVWTHAAFPRDKSSRTYAITGGQALTLQAVVWPASGGPDKARALTKWEGEFIGAALQLGANDTVRGAALVKGPGRAESGPLQLWPWRHDAGGTFQRGEAVLVPNESEAALARAVVGVGNQGEPVCLVRFRGEGWRIFRPETGLQGLPEPLASTELPLELIFANATEPLIKYCEEGRGFYFRNAAGESIIPLHELIS